MEGNSHGKKLCQRKNIFRKTVGPLIMDSCSISFLFIIHSFLCFYLVCCIHSLIAFCCYVCFNPVHYWCIHYMFYFRYNESLELEDAIHTAILTLKVCLKLLKIFGFVGTCIVNSKIVNSKHLCIIGNPWVIFCHSFLNKQQNIRLSHNGRHCDLLK